jgi:predicted heme/steroid binding protein
MLGAHHFHREDVTRATPLRHLSCQTFDVLIYMSSNQTKNAIALGEFIELLTGKIVQISQAISWRPGTDFERHSSVHARFSFRVKKSMWAMSGGHYTLFGGNDISYGIGTSKLFSVEISADEAVVVERYGDEAERQSAIKILAVDAEHAGRRGIADDDSTSN